MMLLSVSEWEFNLWTVPAVPPVTLAHWLTYSLLDVSQSQSFVSRSRWPVQCVK